MAEKKEPIDEQILRFIYNSKFYPEKETAAYRFANPIMDIVGKSRSYDEARNLIIQAMQDEEKLNRLRDISQFYIDTYGTEENPYDAEKTFLGKFDMVPLNADKRNLKDVMEISQKMADALGYSGGLDALLAKINNENTLKTEDDWFEKALNAELKGKLAKNDKTRDLVYTMLDMSPNADDDYVAARIADYVGRAKRAREANEMSGGAQLVQDIAIPYEAQKMREGNKPNAVDVLFDTGTFLPAIGAGAKFSKLKKIKGVEKLANSFDGMPDVVKRVNPLDFENLGLAGMNFLAGLTEPVITRIHDMAEAPLNKTVYANEGLEDEVSKRESPFSEENMRLAELPSELSDAVTKGLARSFAGYGGRAAVSGAKFLADKIGKSKVGRTAMNALFGTKVDAKEKLANIDKAEKSVEKQRNAILKENVDYHTNKKSTVSGMDYINNMKRLDELDAEAADLVASKKAILDMYGKSASEKVGTALDALIASGVVKMGLSPNTKPRDTAKTAYAIDMLL